MLELFWGGGRELVGRSRLRPKFDVPAADDAGGHSKGEAEGEVGLPM